MLKKNLLTLALICVIASCLAGCGSPISSSNSTASQSTQPSSANSASNTIASVRNQQTSSSASSEIQEATSLQSNLDNKFTAAIFYNKVRNDNTDRWRCYVYNSSIAPQDFTLEYYKAYFSDDNEIHALVNMREQTTARISVIGTDLDVTVQKYVKGEEHDANLLFSGDITAEYFVNKESGEIEQVR